MIEIPDRNRLIKDWSRHLIRNQIASLGDSGRLEYHRPVTSDTLMDFLLDEVDGLTREQVIQAMGQSRAFPGLGEAQRVASFPGQSKSVLNYHPTEMDEVQVLRTFDAIVKIFKDRAVEDEESKTKARSNNTQKIFAFIEDSMNDQHRQALYHLLKDHQPQTVAEDSNAGNQELDRIFARASQAPQGMTDRMMGRTRLTKQDLWDRWKRSGRPRGNQALINFLKSSGLSQTAAQSALGIVDSRGDNGRPRTASDMVRPLAQYIIKNDLTEPVLDFLREKFSLKETRYLGRSPKIDSHINESLTAHEVLGSDQYLKVLKFLRSRGGYDIPSVHAKRRIIQSWKSGNKSIKHIDRLLKKVRVKLSDIVK